MGSLLLFFCDDHLLRPEVIEEGGRLGRRQNLRVRRRCPHQSRDNQHRVRVQAQLRFVHDDQIGQFVLGLLEDRNQRNRPQGPIGKLMRAELIILPKLPPIQQDVPGIQLPGLQDEIVERRNDLPNRGPDAAVDLFVGLLVAVQNGG